MGLREWVRGRAGWVAAAALAGLAGASYGLRQAPAPVAAAAPAAAAAAEYVIPDGLVADANLDRGGTDNAAAIQAAVNRALRSNLPVRLPPGRYGVGSTLKVPNGVGFVLGGSGRAEGG